GRAVLVEEEPAAGVGAALHDEQRGPRRERLHGRVVGAGGLLRARVGVQGLEPADGDRGRGLAGRLTGRRGRGGTPGERSAEVRAEAGIVRVGETTMRAVDARHRSARPPTIGVPPADPAAAGAACVTRIHQTNPRRGTAPDHGPAHRPLARRSPQLTRYDPRGQLERRADWTKLPSSMIAGLRRRADRPSAAPAPGGGPRRPRPRYGDRTAPTVTFARGLIRTVAPAP